MSFLISRRCPVTASRKRLALLIALLADGLQIAGFWAFVWGGVSPADSILDVIVAVLLLIIVGPRWQVAAAFAAELVPGIALFPTWSAFVLAMPTQRAEVAELPPIRTPAEPQPDGHSGSRHEPHAGISRIPPRLDSADH